MNTFFSKELLGDLVKATREHRNITQQDLAKSIGKGVNRSTIAHLEQGLRIPQPEQLEYICHFLDIPKKYWHPLVDPKSVNRLDFESYLSELVGLPVSLSNQDSSIIEVVDNLIEDIFRNTYTTEQAYHTFCRILVFYDIYKTTDAFFARYITAEGFKSLLAFENKVKAYQKEAIRLFSSFEEAYLRLNSNNDLLTLLRPLEGSSDEHYRKRTEWNVINNISDEKLPYLGYIAASRVKQEDVERKDLSDFLLELADKIKKGKLNIIEYSEKRRSKYDSLLRKFNSKIEHGLFSPLFSPSAETLEREAKFIRPDDGTNIQEMEQTQKMAYENLTNYLSADFMDVYVATSMRSDADFISVNNFVKSLFDHEDIRPLKLRYFNPTQSWIEDRIAKGLVEALMLKRADFCIYMAQKEDTFGKDSEASVSLGQGKPVIVYVPKLLMPDEKIDSEVMSTWNRVTLLDSISLYDKDFVDNVDESVDQERLLGKLLTVMLEKAVDLSFCKAVALHWADFDLYGEVEKRIEDKAKVTKFTSWMRKAIAGENAIVPIEIKSDLINMLVATTINFGKRARIFKEVHPLALQVILSTGVLNGILVTRSVESCAQIMKGLITGTLDLALEVDSNNYKLIEKTTQSTIRVISRHKLLANSFSAFYRRSIL
ncbi:MAG: helix-turn-helix transcriptional regulator [Flavipsychrobacter sp.]|nr:helix-turn-helix transcriptional regulator [Flavipsychrobacter sp.]